LPHRKLIGKSFKVYPNHLCSLELLRHLAAQAAWTTGDIQNVAGLVKRRMGVAPCRKFHEGMAQVQLVTLSLVFG
jgi:hypothetical protein